MSSTGWMITALVVISAGLTAVHMCAKAYEEELQEQANQQEAAE